ncbi:hypothetical protein ACUXST_000227 [Sphingomonas sp. F9_3S_D5_B_2]|jgi:hypothetical protein
MRKLVFVSASLALLSFEAVAQVRPQDCRPVFPVIDQVAAVVQPDVVAIQEGPAPVARRRFFGVAYLIPLIAVGGIVVLTGGHHHHHRDTVSPA